MEEKLEEVVEETTQDQTVETVDESKFESAGDDSVIKVDLSAPPQEKIETGSCLLVFDNKLKCNYIDNNQNVYKTEDIMNGIENPKIIAKYIKNAGNITC